MILSAAFFGRAVVALGSDLGVVEKTGHVLVAAKIAQEYGFTDIDGKTPRPPTIGDV
jgi:hypothetical protein